MPWVSFEKAEQDAPAAQSADSGRPKEMTVLNRERDRPLGNVIRFDDSTYITVANAKGE